MAGRSTKKNGGYAAGKLEADIAYIKAGIIDLQEKADEAVKAVAEAKLVAETSVVRITVLEDGVRTQSSRMDAVLRESRWTGGISGVASVVAAAVVAAFMRPK